MNKSVVSSSCVWVLTVDNGWKNPAYQDVKIGLVVPYDAHLYKAAWKVQSGSHC